VRLARFRQNGDRESKPVRYFIEWGGYVEREMALASLGYRPAGAAALNHAATELSVAGQGGFGNGRFGANTPGYKHVMPPIDDGPRHSRRELDLHGGQRRSVHP
jgi:hypothetical protein